MTLRRAGAGADIALEPPIMRLTRRNALQALTTLPGLLSIGCSGSPEESGELDEAVVSGPEILRRYKKFVVVVMENRSFDHYFGHLSLPTSEGGEGRTDVNGFSRIANHTNPDLNGNKVAIHRASHHAIGDIDHEWEACHEQFGNGAMDGFVKAHQRDLLNLNVLNDKGKPTARCWGTTEDAGKPARCGEPNDPMAYYTRQDTPVFHQLLDEYALCDNWFASVMGPTWPNRYYLHAASAGSRKLNKPLSGLGTTARNSIFGQVTSGTRNLAREYPGLDPNRLCVNFFSDVPLLPLMFPTAAGLANGLDFIDFLPNFNYAHLFDAPRDGGLAGLSTLAGSIFGDRAPKSLLDFVAKSRNFPTFETLARQGKLPPISYIEPPYQLAPMDDHPPHDILAGQAFVSAIYKILQNSPDWKDTCLIVTYDEHGSFYDHVKPGVVNEESDPEFRQLGFRVPAIVIGPGIKKKYVSKVQYDHCSVLSTFTNRFGVAPSNDRVRVARDISDCVETSTAGGATGGIAMRRVDLRESNVLDSAEIADGQKEIVQKIFGGNVPFEAKRVFTAGMLETFDRLGVASIR